MGPFDRPPMLDYCFKLMLLDAIKCYNEDNGAAIHWLENQMYKIIARWEELTKQDK